MIRRWKAGRRLRKALRHAVREMLLSGATVHDVALPYGPGVAHVRLHKISGVIYALPVGEETKAHKIATVNE